MDKKLYLQNRQILVDAAQGLINEGKLEEANAKMQEVEALDKQFEDACKAQANMNALKDNAVVTNIAAKSVTVEGQIFDKTVEPNNLSAQRGQDLKLNNAVTVGSGTILMPKHQADDIRPTFNQVSTLIDLVDRKDLIGGESFSQPYVAGYGTGDYTAESADAATAETVFAYATINKAKVTAYAEDTEEIQKLPAADYDGEVMKGISIASRKKVSREILVGAGGANQLTGIFSATATAIDVATDLEISKIDDQTLDDIVYSYGGDEDVEDAAVLILNKKDLKAFARLRNADGKKVHNTVTKGNTGTIDGIPFIINSACKAISDGATATGQYGMAYGSLSNYLLTIFSDMDVKRSEDYKFKQGMICHRGVIFAGGNVVSKNGFLRIKKAAAV